MRPIAPRPGPFLAVVDEPMNGESKDIRSKWRKKFLVVIRVIDGCGQNGIEPEDLRGYSVVVKSGYVADDVFHGERVA